MPRMVVSEEGPHFLCRDVPREYQECVFGIPVDSDKPEVIVFESIVHVECRVVRILFEHQFTRFSLVISF